MGEILMGSLPGIYIRNRGSPYSRTEYRILGLYSISGVLASTPFVGVIIWLLVLKGARGNGSL